MDGITNKFNNRSNPPVRYFKTTNFSSKGSILKNPRGASLMVFSFISSLSFTSSLLDLLGFLHGRYAFISILKQNQK